MGLAENIRGRRRALKLSQGYVADQLGVSRQAVSKWETGQSVPSAANLADLAELLETSVSELALPREESDQPGSCDNACVEKQPNEILRLNLSILAIAFQAGALYACTQPPHVLSGSGEGIDQGFALFRIGVLLLCSCWMAFNLRHEKDFDQRRKNVRIELLYCCVQLGIALLTIHFGLQGLAGLSPTAAVLIFYILYVNPKCMNRPFGRKRTT